MLSHFALLPPRLSLCPFSFQSINSNIRPATSCIFFFFMKCLFHPVSGFPSTEMSQMLCPVVCQDLLHELVIITVCENSVKDIFMNLDEEHFGLFLHPE